MSIIHLDANASAEEAYTLVKEHGYVVLDRLASSEQMDRFQAEIAPYVKRTGFGECEMTGTLTKRTGGLVARSPQAREFIMNPLVLGIVGRCLGHAGSFQLSLTELITLAPGARAQFIHRDEVTFGNYDFGKSYEAQISVLWAVTDYTEEMGATRIVPGSHLLPPDMRIAPEDTIPAVMDRGSALLYSGKLYHGGGENRSSRVRQAMSIDYAVGWLRQEENQYLSCSKEIAQTLPVDLLKLMGYAATGGHGRAMDWIDPLSFILDKPQRIAENEMLDADDIYHSTTA